MFSVSTSLLWKNTIYRIIMLVVFIDSLGYNGGVRKNSDLEDQT